MPSPPYVAEIECVPAANAEVENVATPPMSIPVPSAAVPSENVTGPVAAAGVTVAVNVTDCPTTDGFTLEETFVTGTHAFSVALTYSGTDT